jgi:large subunit ribosomal protein L22
MDTKRLYISECFVSPGPIMKRMRPMSHGRAFRVLKRSSHVTMALKERPEDSNAK